VVRMKRSASIPTFLYPVINNHDSQRAMAPASPKYHNHNLSSLPPPAHHRPNIHHLSYTLFSREFWRTFRVRAAWLVVLLVLQSASSVILARYDTLIQNHFIIALFLTMIVGAGGNAGNQSTVALVRHLASSSSSLSSSRTWVWRCKVIRYEVLLGVLVGSVLAVVAWLRVFLTHRELVPATAIAASLLAVVVSAKLFGTTLPIAFSAIGIDPAHAAPTIQVVMDISGVLITCAVSSAFFLLSDARS